MTDRTLPSSRTGFGPDRLHLTVADFDGACRVAAHTRKWTLRGRDGIRRIGAAVLVRADIARAGHRRQNPAGHSLSLRATSTSRSAYPTFSRGHSTWHAGARRGQSLH